MPELLTPNAVVIKLSDLARQLDSTVEELRTADLAAVMARHDADVSESRMFIESEGSVDLRKHLARERNAHLEADALAKEAVVRYLRHRISALSTRIDVGRSMGAALRAELQALPGDQP